MTREEFDAEISRLSVLRNVPEDIEPWWKPLQSVPLDLFAGAVDLALETRVFFPLPAEFRIDVDVVTASRRTVTKAPDREVALDGAVVRHIRNPWTGVDHPIKVLREWGYYCDTCEDTGIVSHWCGTESPKPWYVLRACGRPKAHYAHEFVDDCVCLTTNPALRKKRERLEAYAKEPAKVLTEPKRWK